MLRWYRGTESIAHPQSLLRVLALSALVLGLGVLVYLWDRPPGSTLLLPDGIGHRAGDVYFFGVMGGSLPSFTHAFAFTLFTSVLLGRTVRARWISGVSWWVIGTFFEVAQHPASRDWFAMHFPALASHYFPRGTFDTFDLLATTLGVLAAVLCHFRFISGTSK